MSRSQLISLIDQFVATITQRGLEPLFAEDVPAFLRVNEIPEGDWFYWRFQRHDSYAELKGLEERLPNPFPKAYREFLGRYRFPEFEIGSIMFFANTGEDVTHELCRAIFCDKGLWPALHGDGFLQFGRAEGGGYDPICFDSRRSRVRDSPIVQIDHEDILIRNKIKIRREIASSFKAFMEQIVGSTFHQG